MNVQRDRKKGPSAAEQRVTTGPAGGARRRTAVLLPLALLAVGSLAGCTSLAVAPGSPASSAAVPSASAASPVAVTSPTSPTASSSPGSAAAPLTCDDLVSTQQIASALSGGKTDDRVVVSGSTAAGTITGELAVEGAGGLSCSWTAGPSASGTTRPVLTIALLPDAAKAWTATLYGDGPSSDRRTFAGVSAAASCGDPGCGASAPVGSSWVRVDLATGSREGGDSVFAKETDDEVFAALRPAVESVFRTVQGASAEQLRFPDHLASDSTPADCHSSLSKADLAGALRLKRVSLDTRYQMTPEQWSIVGAAEQRIGTSVCDVLGHATSNDYEAAGITVEPGQAWAVDRLASNAAARGTFHVTTLQGQRSGEHAVTDCTSSGRICTVVLSLGSTAIQVGETERAVQVAEAVIAGAR